MASVLLGRIVQTDDKRHRVIVHCVLILRYSAQPFATIGGYSFQSGFAEL
jgi:hypothetical protein